MHSYEEQEYSKRFDATLWRKLLRYARPFWKNLAWLGVVMIGVAAIDALFPLMNRYAIDHFMTGNSAGASGANRHIVGFIAAYALLVIVQAANVRFLIIFAGKIETGLCYDLRTAGFRRLQELSFSYYDRTPIGWIMARMTSDSDRLGATISWGLVDMVWGGALMVAISIFMLFMNWKLGLMALAVLPPLVFASLYFQNRILKSNRLVRKTNSRISGAYNEGIMGARTTKILVRERENLAEFKDLTELMKRSSVKTAIFSALYLPIVLTLGSIGTGLVLWNGGAAVMVGSITYGTLVAFLSYTVQFFEPVRELARVLSEMQSAQAAGERLVSMIETEPEIQDRPDVIERYGDQFSRRTENWKRPSGAITFDNVGFTYPGGETVLADFSLSVGSGETVALVGETGSGKSTIVNLACRFYEPTEGRILVDGTDYRERSQLWHQSHLGYVLQSPHLFSGTILENIRYGRLEATEAEVMAAAELVHAHRFIEGKPDGYGTEVGEGGSLLSTGEKQLISFARAILADPVFFVLDEATSSIDTETEAIIQDAIERVLKDRTSFVIAHRLSTIRHADRILVLQRGRIVESGTHKELMRARNYYYRLYTNQFVEEEEEHILEEA
jgi:ATP-binding cassette subfamily B protein